MPTVSVTQLRKAEAKFRKDYAAAEHSRAQRNELIREARASGWTLQQIADATGLTRGRLSQIVTGKETA